jgi:hypothetical protein
MSRSGRENLVAQAKLNEQRKKKRNGKTRLKRKGQPE